MTEIPFDADAHKDAVRRQWDAAAQGWNDWTPRLRDWLGDATQTMLDLADVRPGGRVLDVAAGAGDQTHDVARRVGPAGSVLATDISAGILAFAEENARRAGFTNVAFKVCDGEAMELDAATFDAAVCRLGLMFYPDPLKGLAEIRRALRPGGRLCTMVFSVPEQNPCLVVSASVACRHAGIAPPTPDRPGLLMSLGAPGRIEALFGRAVYDEVETRRCGLVFRLASAKAFVAFTQAAAGPISQMLAPLAPAAKNAAWREMEERLTTFETGDGFAGPFEVLLTRGRRE